MRCMKHCDSSHVSIIILIMNFKQFQAWGDYGRHARWHVPPETLQMHNSGMTYRVSRSASGLPFGVTLSCRCLQDLLPVALVPRRDWGPLLEPKAKALLGTELLSCELAWSENCTYLWHKVKLPIVVHSVVCTLQKVKVFCS